MRDLLSGSGLGVYLDCYPQGAGWSELSSPVSSREVRIETICFDLALSRSFVGGKLSSLSLTPLPLISQLPSLAAFLLVIIQRQNKRNIASSAVGMPT